MEIFIFFFVSSDFSSDVLLIFSCFCRMEKNMDEETFFPNNYWYFQRRLKNNLEGGKNVKGESGLIHVFYDSVIVGKWH